MRPLGHIPDTRRPVGSVHHSALVGAVVVPPTALVPYVVDDQGGQDCTGSYGKLVESWAAARGLPCAPVSRRFTYTLGRMTGDPQGRLADVGAQPADVVDGMRTFGVVPETAWPGDDPTVINAPCDLFALELATTFRVDQIAPIEDAGDTRCTAMRTALAAGFPVGVGMCVDALFESWAGGMVYDGPTGPSLGGHAVRICGYRPGAFLLVNSWGAMWGDAGCAWVSDAFIGSGAVFDPYILSFAKAVHS